MSNKNTTLLSISKARELFVKSLEKSNRSTNTIIAYNGDLSQLEQFFAGRKQGFVDGIELKDLEEFKKFLEKEKYTAKSISRKLNSIKSFFKFLFQEEVLQRDPSREVSHPKIKLDLPKILKPMEYRALRDVCRSDLRILAVIELILQTGLRISEIANLKLSDVNEDELIIQAQESHPKRQVPLNGPAQKVLQDYLQIRPEVRTDYIFVTKTGRQLLVRNIRTAIGRYFYKAGVEEAKVNDLRNTFIVKQLEAGVPLEVVARIVGHRRLSTTEKYLRLVSNQKRPSRGFHLVEL